MTSLSDTQFQMNQGPNTPTIFTLPTCTDVASFKFSSLHLSLMTEKSNRILLIVMMQRGNESYRVGVGGNIASLFEICT